MFTIDIKAIKKYLLDDTSRIEELLEYFEFHGFNYTSDSLRCAVPDGDNTSSVAIYLTEYLSGVVFTRGSFTGDVFQIICHVTSRSLSDVLMVTRSLFGISSNGYKGKVKSIDILKDMKKYRKGKQLDSENELYDESVLRNLVMLPHEEIINEGIVPSVCNQFNVCYDPRDDRVIFPHYSWEFPDKIVGLQGRKVGMSNEDAKLLGIPKYINKIKGYKKLENLFGWNQAIENVRREKQIILFEGEKSVLKEFTAKRGVGISVALGGHIISDTHIKIIAQNTPLDTEVVLAFDRDVLDDPEEFKIMMGQAKKLNMFRKVSYIQDDFPVGRLLNEKDSPIDNGHRIFNYLFESRKRVNKE